jgi:hypothetical protein
MMRYQIIAKMTKLYIDENPSMKDCPKRGEHWIYVSTYHRDINYAFNLLRSYNDNPGQYIWEVEEKET